MLLSDLKTIQTSQIEKIYSGRSGCMCGCRGNYREGKASGRILANMVRYAEQNGIAVERDGSHVYVDDGKKNYVIYLAGIAAGEVES